MRTTLSLVGLALGLAWMAATALANDNAFRSAEGGVRVQDLAAGTGEEAAPGMIATIHYRGWIDDAGSRGREFFDSRRQGEAVRFVIGTDKVMPAWNATVEGMRVGGRRMSLVPPAMAYGARGVDGIIPADAPLILQIDLVALEPLPAEN